MAEGPPNNLAGELPNISPESPIDKKAEAFRTTLRRMFQIMQKHNIYAIKSLGNLADFELAHADPSVETELENQMVEFYKHGSSGYFTFEGAHPELKTVLFKLKLQDVDPRGSAHNEMLFYRDIAPELEDFLEEKPLKLPELFDAGYSEEGHSFIITEFAEGEILGSLPYDAEKPLSIEEFQQLIELIKYFQETLTPEKVKESSPEMVFDPSKANSTYKKYGEILKMYQNKWADVLGPEYIAKLGKLLLENEEFLKSTPEVINNQDINPANIIRSQDGTFTVIDWERLRKVPNPAAAYNHIIESHWRYPELQDEMIRRVLELNKDDPNSRQLLRIDMLFAKYSFIYHPLSLDPNLSQEKSAEVKAGLASVLRFIKQAVDEEGPWKKE